MREINQQVSGEIFDQNDRIGNLHFKVINPYFFGFLRRSNAPHEVAHPAQGITIEWQNDRPPRVTLADFLTNESAQLFYQMYENQMVELG